MEESGLREIKEVTLMVMLGRNELGWSAEYILRVIYIYVILEAHVLKYLTVIISERGFIDGIYFSLYFVFQIFYKWTCIAFIIEKKLQIGNIIVYSTIFYANFHEKLFKSFILNLDQRNFSDLCISHLAGPNLEDL